MLILLPLLGFLIVAKGYWNATRDPVIRTATITVADWPAGAPPLRVLHLSDVHVGGPDMPPERLVRIARRLNALEPDLVLIAGDLVGERGLGRKAYRSKDIAAPLGGLRARLGVILTLGNHDHWFDAEALARDLESHGVTVLRNAAVRRGPIVVGGVDDDYTGHDDVATTFTAMQALGARPRIMLTHSPDIVPDLPSRVAAVFAGHTHCGQVVLPLIGAFTYVSRYGDRFACGMIDDRGQKVVVGAGIGTSTFPLRYGAMPDAWLVTLSGRRS